MADENRPEGEAPPESTPPASDKPAEPQVSPPAASPEAAHEAKPAAEAAPAAEKPAAPSGDAAPAKPAAAAEKPAAPAKPPPKKAPTVMEAEPWEGPIADRLKQRFGDSIKECSTYRGQDFVVIDLPSVIAIIDHLKDEEDFDYLVDITAADYPKREEGKRFDLFWILYSFRQNVRVRVKAQADEGEKAPTASEAYPTANWLEREVFDMFGIEFEGHPNMTRILMPDEWEGHPLRKDYSIIQQDEAWVRENLQIESGQ
jgi:NADH-quinone oxidoreductase subunit C